MGGVYKAQDTKLDRIVALKFLPHHLTPNDAEKARLLQEVRAAAALNHPNICSVIDVQEEEGEMFIVMEYVEGQTLKERMAGMTVKQAVETGIQIADGLSGGTREGGCPPRRQAGKHHDPERRNRADHGFRSGKASRSHRPDQGREHGRVKGTIEHLSKGGQRRGDRRNSP